MHITKLGHCCLLIETNDKHILTDPGFLSTEQNNLLNLDIILITHEHKDHLHTESLEIVLKNNPKAVVITNSSVGKILTDLKIPYSVLEGGDTAQFCDIDLSACDGKHAEIVGEYGQVQNTGYFIDEKLFYPGDAYTNPKREVTALALPVAGPWCKVSDAIKYALEIKPRVAFPVHDGVLNEAGQAITHGVVGTKLAESGTHFVALRTGEGFEVE